MARLPQKGPRIHVDFFAAKGHLIGGFFPPIWKICASQIGNFPKIGVKIKNTLPKTNMDTQNDGLEKVTGPLKNGNFWYLC